MVRSRSALLQRGVESAKVVGFCFNLAKRRQREDHSAVFTYLTVSNKDRIKLCIAKEQEASTPKL